MNKPAQAAAALQSRNFPKPKSIMCLLSSLETIHLVSNATMMGLTPSQSTPSFPALCISAATSIDRYPVQNLGTARLPNLHRMRHTDFRKNMNILIF
jgi:hypothetical protein